MENRREKPDWSCQTIAAAATYVGIPMLAATPFLVTYLITGDIGEAIAYPIIVACLIPIVLVALATALWVVAALIYQSWETIAMPVAQWCQDLKDHRRGRTREREP